MGTPIPPRSGAKTATDGTRFEVPAGTYIAGDVFSATGPAVNGVVPMELVNSSTFGGGGVSISGTPVANQVAVWTDAETIKGDSGVTLSDGVATFQNEIIAKGIHVTNSNGWNFKTSADNGLLEIWNTNNHTANAVGLRVSRGSQGGAGFRLALSESGGIYKTSITQKDGAARFHVVTDGTGVGDAKVYADLTVVGGATFGGLVKLGSFTFSTLPSAAANPRGMCGVSDRNNKLHYSDGTNWLVFTQSVAT